MKPSLLLLAVAAFLVTACASSVVRGTRTAETLSSVSRDLFFSTTGLPNIHTIEYAITRDAKITRMDDDWERKWFKKRTSIRRLTREGWENFEKTLVRLHVDHWKSAYHPSAMVYDGYGWELRTSAGARIVKSGGGNAGPSPNDPEQTISVIDTKKTSADIILAGALEDLWKSSVR